MTPEQAPVLDQRLSLSDSPGSGHVAFLASRMDPERRVLNLLRQGIYKLGQSLGQPVWVAEWSSGELQGQSAEDVQISCLQRVRDIPEFICILDGSYGTPWNVAQLCVLELEVFSAALAGKPIHFFLLDPYEPDPRTETLLGAVRLASPGLGDMTPRSPEEVLLELESRLARGPKNRDDGRFWSKGSGAVMVPEGAVDMDVRFLDGKFAPIQEGKPRHEFIRELLSTSASKGDEATRLVYTWMAIRHLCAVPYSDPSCADFLPLWDAALSQWASAAAWYGLHGHNYLGRLAAVNTIIWIREHASEGGYGGLSLQGSYGARASEYYSMAKTARSRSLRRFLLGRALVDVQRALDAGGSDPSGLLAIRGSVLQALGKRWTGLRDYRSVLQMRMANRESLGRIGEAEAELGMGYLRVGRIWKGAGT